jgi:hypothetical protein
MYINPNCSRPQNCGKTRPEKYSMSACKASQLGLSVRDMIRAVLSLKSLVAPGRQCNKTKQLKLCQPGHHLMHRQATAFANIIG